MTPYYCTKRSYGVIGSIKINYTFFLTLNGTLDGAKVGTQIKTFLNEKKKLKRNEK